MPRLRYTGLKATLGADLTATATTITFAAALTHTGGSGPGTAVPTIGAGDSIPLTIQNATGAAETVSLTAYTAGATTGTIARGQDGTAGIAHTAGARILHTVTPVDLGAGGLGIIYGTGSPYNVVRAPTGALYVDMAATAGASLWVKASGAAGSANGWVVSQGDTGWRAVAAWDATGAFTTGSLGEKFAPRPGNTGYVHVRRTERNAMVRILNLSAAVAIGSTLDVVVPGTGAAWQGFQALTPMNAPTSGGTSKLVLRTDGGGGGGVTSYIIGGATAGEILIGGTVAIWVGPTDQPWPTTLPGIAA